MIEARAVYVLLSHPKRHNPIEKKTKKRVSSIASLYPPPPLGSFPPVRWSANTPIGPTCSRVSVGERYVFVMDHDHDHWECRVGIPAPAGWTTCSRENDPERTPCPNRSARVFVWYQMPCQPDSVARLHSRERPRKGRDPDRRLGYAQKASHPRWHRRPTPPGAASAIDQFDISGREE